MVLTLFAFNLSSRQLMLGLGIFSTEFRLLLHNTGYILWGKYGPFISLIPILFLSKE